ncbi:Membrane protein [Ceratocystis lukuohia]|uniref:Membrane protein n=1 Tax=Ceratocystis lukuohia TaxID=2019550 RepID=A0ABR4MN63_9PEZI
MAPQKSEMRKCAAKNALSPSRSTSIGEKQDAKAINEMPPRKRRRQANIYDAVAGLVTSHQGNGLAHRQNDTTWHMNNSGQASTRHSVLAPHEALFRTANAPDLFAEYDLYNSHERLLPNTGEGVLPSSELLKALHSYSSRFYDALGTLPTGQHKKAHFVGQRNINERSMDETALLAFGILLEEAGREVLGQKGDLVFTEGREVTATKSPSKGDATVATSVEETDSATVGVDNGTCNDGQVNTTVDRLYASIEQPENIVGAADTDNPWPRRKRHNKRRRLDTIQ